MNTPTLQAIAGDQRSRITLMIEGTDTAFVAADVLVIGAGPSGLATAKCLIDRGVSVVIADRSGLAGGAYRRMYPRLALSSPSRFLSLPGMQLRSTGSYTRAKEYAEYLSAYADRHRIFIAHNEVVRIAQSSTGLVVTFIDDQSFNFRAVIVATGMCDYPVSPLIPGLVQHAAGPHILHVQDWLGPSRWTTSRVLIVGGGMRAVEVAEECAAAGIRPVVSARGGHINTWSPIIFGWDIRHVGFALLHHLPMRLAGTYCGTGWKFRAIDRGFKRLLAEDRIAVVPEILQVNGNNVQFANGSSIRVDVVVLATGYKYTMPFLPESVSRSRQGYPFVIQGQCIALPNVYFVGIPCAFHLDSQFVHGMAADAKAVATAVATSQVRGRDNTNHFKYMVSQ